MELLMQSKTGLLSFLSVTVLTAVFRRISPDNSFSRYNLRNIVVDEDNGVLYLGGDRDLYKLNAGDLSILNSTHYCSSCYSKILLKTVNNTLLVCGIDANGTCALYHVTNLTRVLLSNDNSELCINGYQNKTAVSLVNSNGTDLYVGLTYDQKPSDGRHHLIMNGATNSACVFKIIQNGIEPSLSSRRTLNIKDDIENYLIYFRAVFQTEKYVYFLTNQKLKKIYDSPYVSKLIRICKNDFAFYSYIDLELECKNIEGDKLSLVQHGLLIELGDKLSTSEENQALVATFAAGTEPENPWSNRSAICLYTLKQIKEAIIDAQTRIVSKCDASGKFVYNESNTYIDRKASGSPNCQNNPFVTMYMNCTSNSFESYKILSSFDTTLNSTAVFNVSDSRLGKIAGGSLDEGYSELLVGTDTGSIMKMALFNITKAVHYDTYKVDSDQPIEAIYRGKDVDYFLTSRKLVKVAAAQDCSKYLTCDQCQASNNPYCGWCILEEKCSRMKSCRTKENNTWIPTPNKCISQIVSPKASYINTNTTLKIILTPFPSFENGTYSCSFTTNGNKILDVLAKRENEILYCTSPNITKHTATDLDILVTKNNQTAKLTSLPFLFYSCSNFTRCKTCTSDSYGGCNWCVSNTTVMCSNNGSCSTNYTYMEANRCPRLMDSRGKIFVPNVLPSFYFYAAHLPEVGVFHCVIAGSVKLIANISRTSENSSMVTCLVNYYVQIKVKESKENISLELLYPNHHTVDDDYRNYVEVYQCDKLALDCSQCSAFKVNISSPYRHCLWGNTSTSTAGCFYNTSNVKPLPCGLPVINSFSPLDGPVGGGTLITIKGKDFGVTYEDIENITVAGITCEIDKNTFEVVGIVVCRSNSSFIEKHGPVSISMQGKSVQFGNFTFKKPNITDVKPTTGLMAGGTRLTISGTNLLIGNEDVKVTLSDGTENHSCNIEIKESGKWSGNKDRIMCETSSVGNIQNVSISVTFDKRDHKTAYQKFSYLENPIIKSIHPNKSMASGGIKLTIKGEYLDNANFIQIESVENDNVSVPCKLDSAQQMICTTPGLSEEQKKNLDKVNSTSTIRRKRSELCPGCFEIKIKLDGFERKFTLSYTVDPKVLDLSGENKIHIYSPTKNRTLTLKGRNLLWENDDISISIGYEKCVLVKVTESSIDCTPPDQQPKSDEKYPVVSVQIGNFKKMVGYLKYENEPVTIIVIASIAGVLLIALILVAIIFLRNSRRLRRKAEELEKQIQDWEMEIRNVSREEFADLQTSIKKVTSSLVERGFPYRVYQYYSFKMLFPTADMETHTVMLDLQVSDGMRNRLNKGLEMLEDLLYNKFFLKSLILTIERQPQRKLSPRERAEFSSMLSVVLLGKMEYFYEIIEILLPELVQESISKKSHKALFRRCESVTEKLLMNLLSLCLYPHLKKHGSSLYMMLKAIQIQMEKGPIDQLTGHAKYTLSEDQLLTKLSATENELVLESKPLKLNVSVLDQYYECTVLDCDTITQVKDKCLAQIYINFPASNRGTADDVVLEWHAGSSGCLQLHDIDVSNSVSDGWRRLNTLAHYNVWDGCTMALVETNTQKEDYVNLSNKQIHFEITGATESIRLMPSGSQSSTSDTDTYQETKLWHVVKLEDKSQKKARTKDLVELYLNRLLSVKISILPYIKELFDSILDANGVPIMVKSLYDLLDNLADKHKLDEDTLHVWKSHSYPIRFWAGLITKPDVVFDINKPGYTDKCLEIISQTFIDSFSTTSHNVNKDSATHKLLFTTEMDEYRVKVNEFYSDVKSANTMTIVDFQQDLKELNKEQNKELAYKKMSALYEIFKVINIFMVDVIDDLQENPEARTLRLADRLDQLVSIIQDDEDETLYSDFPGTKE